MPRNLDNRIEVLTPVYDKVIQAELKRVVCYGLRDTAKGRIVDGSGENKTWENSDAPFRSQEDKQLMKIFEVSDYRACATSAMRDARNGKEITRKIEKKTGIRVEIIDGQEEAHIVYDNHIEQLFASGQNYLYVDGGGGSTEINLICDSELKSSRSYNIGTVRMLSGMVKNEEKEQMRTALQALAAEYAPIQIIVSSTASIPRICTWKRTLNKTGHHRLHRLTQIIYRVDS